MLEGTRSVALNLDRTFWLLIDEQSSHRCFRNSTLFQHKRRLGLRHLLRIDHNCFFTCLNTATSNGCIKCAVFSGKHLKGTQCSLHRPITSLLKCDDRLFPIASFGSSEFLAHRTTTFANQRFKCFILNQLLSQVSYSTNRRGNPSVLIRLRITPYSFFAEDL